jgi:hypothetical protein
MRRTLILLLLGGAGLVAATAALAGDHCDRPMRDWRPRQAVEETARKLGVEVRRIRTDDGCYKIYGRTADGRSVEIELDPVTLKVIETEYGDRARRDNHGRAEHKRAAQPTRPAASANPPVGPATGATK